MKAALAQLCIGGVALAAPASYNGARASFAIPDGAKVTDGSDIVADWALDIADPAFPTVRFHLIGSDGKVGDLELDPQAAVWRDKHLRNRASWGVHGSGEHRVDSVRIAARRTVRLVDDLDSSLGGRQTMLCTIVSTHVLCATAVGPIDQAHSAETILTRILETLALKKR